MTVRNLVACRLSIYLKLCAILFAVCGLSESQAAELPSKPILRIDVGMHTARIFRIGIDRGNRYLVTSSSDKTVKLWDLVTGTLIRTFRPPIGEDNEGRLDGIAISPDGSTVAAGGMTRAGESTNNIYIFERLTGRLKQRITDLSNAIEHLAYSPDGRYLLACLWGNHGIRLYRTSDYSLTDVDKAYLGDSYGAVFDQDGRLVTTSYDGYIRLYSTEGGSLRLLAKEKGKGGSRPYSVSISSLDGKIAVGYSDSTKIDVLSAQDLAYLYSPDTTGMKTTLLAVSWSEDGRDLYAGGRYSSSGFRMFKWSDQGRGSRNGLKSANNTILHILPMKGGSIVFGSSEPTFGIINGNDERVLFKSPYTADFNGLKEFLVSYDGLMVQYHYEQGGKSPATFSVAESLLDSSPKTNVSILKLPITKAEGINVTSWNDSAVPKFNGQPLTLGLNEISRRLAIAPSGETFLLGTEFRLRLFDRNGNQIWQILSPSVTWGVNISGNGKMAVAAFGDGTIRWYRMTDGKELLAFFPHNDRKRWVLWCPTGYYDCSPGAEELIGWHINNGKDQAADFFPASRFRGTYNRPDVVSKVLGVLSEEEAIRSANEESGRKGEGVALRQQLPPVLTILSPPENQTISSTDMVIRYNVRMPSGEPVTGIKVLVDGRPVSSQRGLTITPKEGEIRELKITVPERNIEVSLIAENRYTTSEPAIVRLQWAGVSPKKDEFFIQPKLYLLAIGVSAYQDKELALQYAGKDAQDFVGAIQKQKGGLYRDVAAKVLTDSQATKDEILDGLDWLQKETTSKDVAMIFIAGHGINDPAGIYYYLPVNANIDSLKRTGVAFSDIKNTIASIAGKAVLFVDTCHSGNVMGKRRGNTDINALVNELASADNGAVVFASSTGRQYSMEDVKWGNGAFTKALVEGINGERDMQNYAKGGRITINMLDLYLSERVKELTGGKQTPTTTKPQTIQDFPIAMKR